MTRMGAGAAASGPSQRVRVCRVTVAANPLPVSHMREMHHLPASRVQTDANVEGICLSDHGIAHHQIIGSNTCRFKLHTGVQDLPVAPASHDAATR